MKMRTFIVMLCSMLLTAGIAAAQVGQGVVGVPWLGWIFDTEGRALRPITGIPMSALMGDKVDLELSLAVGSPEGSFALGVAAESGRVLIVQGSNSAELVGAKANPTRIVMSARGRVAALYYEDGNLVQVFDGLPASGRLARELTLDSVPVALAIDDAASTVLASAEGGLYAYKLEQGKQLLIPSSGILEANFFAGSNDVVALNADKITLLRDGQTVELGVQEDIVNPVRAAISGDGRSLITLLKQGNIVIRNLKAGTSKMLQCDCTPTDLARLHGNSVFRLNSLKDGTVWLVNGDDDEPKVTFVATRGEN